MKLEKSNALGKKKLTGGESNDYATAGKGVTG